MNDSQLKQVLALAWDLVQKEHELLRLAISTAQDMGTSLIAKTEPTPQQWSAWDEAQKRAIDKLPELTASLESIRRIVEPLFPMDS